MNTARGLIKPLLVGQKRNTFGVGKKTHEPAAGNDWWLKGFENALHNIGRNEDGQKSPPNATDPTFQNFGPRLHDGGKHMGLYQYFVKGQKMRGTITELPAKRRKGKKRKSDALDENTSDNLSSDDKSLSNGSGSDMSKKHIATSRSEFEQIGRFLDARDKDQKRNGRRPCTDVVSEFEQVGRFFQARTNKGRQKERQGIHNTPITKSAGSMSDSEPDTKSNQTRPDVGSTAHRDESASNGLSRKKKKKKRQPREHPQQPSAGMSARLDGTGPCSTHGVPQISSVQANSPPADDLLRRAERKRRKQTEREAK